MLWNVAQKSDAMMMVGANPNEWGFIEALVDLHRQGFLGRPFYLEAEYIHDVRSLWAETPWRRKSVPIRYCTHPGHCSDLPIDSVSCVTPELDCRRAEQALSDDGTFTASNSSSDLPHYHEAKCGFILRVSERKDF